MIKLNMCYKKKKERKLEPVKTITDIFESLLTSYLMIIFN